MHVFFFLAIAFAVMMAVIGAVIVAGTALAKTAQGAVTRTEVTGNTISKVAFGVLWVLVLGVSSGLIGSG